MTTLKQITSRLEKQIASDKPGALISILETQLGLKFKGPYSDGREWDAKVKLTQARAMKFLGKMADTLEGMGIKSPSQNIRSQFSFKVNKTTDIGIDYNDNELEIVIYVD